MKEFSCGAVVPNCAAVFKAETDAEMFEQVSAHAREAHGMQEVPPDVVEKVKANIREVPA